MDVLREKSIIVLHDHLVMELQLHKVKVFVAVQLQCQQNIPKSRGIEVLAGKFVFDPGQGQPDLLAINLCFIAFFELPQEGFHLSKTAAHQASTDHIDHIDFRDEIRKAICIVISSLNPAQPSTGSTRGCGCEML